MYNLLYNLKRFSDAAARNILQQRKFKQFNTLKYKPNATTQPLTQKEKPRNPLYSDILKRKKSNTNLKRRTSESNTLANKPTTVEQLKTLNRNNKGKSPSRSTSSTNQGQEESLKQQIKQLQQEVRDLKGNSNINETNNNSLFKEPKQQPTKRRDGLQQQRGSTKKYGNNKHDKLHRANHENIKKLWRTFEYTTRYQSDPIGHVINLIKKTFTKGTFQLLNKNLNFIPHLKYTIKINSIKN